MSGLLAFVALWGSCATGPRLYVPEPHDLSCRRDSDCQIAASDPASCCGTAEEPFAISKAALHHQEEINRKRCPQICTAILHTCCCTKTTDWTAVCARGVCQRRSTHFFSASPSCRS
jgi:hypothetical protein